MVLEPSYPGDDIIPSAAMTYNRSIPMNAPASVVFLWLVQLGKNRAGWYLPFSWERVLPKSWPAARQIEECWQDLSAGDRVPDYGMSKDDYFDVAVLDAPSALVYVSERYGAVFTWALLVREHNVEEDGSGCGGDSEKCTVHLRFRGQIASTGWKRRLIVRVGEHFDYWTTTPMLKGLKERAETAVGA